MAPVGMIRRGWQGGEDDFCLSPIGHVLSLEEICGIGLAEILARLMNDTWSVKLVREPIRLGLIGGGLKPDEALKKVKVHVEENPAGLAPSVLLAAAIVQAAIYGAPPDDPVGKPLAPGDETDQESSTTTVASGAQESTGSAPQ